MSREPDHHRTGCFIPLGVCLTCELEAQVEDLRAEVAELRDQANRFLQWMLQQ